MYGLSGKVLLVFYKTNPNLNLMKKGIIILVIILIISLFFNFILLIRSGDTMPCDNDGRYPKDEKTGALRLDESAARDLVLRYRDQNPVDSTNNHPTGFVFTKKMFDEIFQDRTLNSVTLDMVTYDDNISLVVRGFKTNTVAIDGDSESRIYVIRSFCPIDCSVW